MDASSSSSSPPQGETKQEQKSQTSIVQLQALFRGRLARRQASGQLVSDRLTQHRELREQQNNITFKHHTQDEKGYISSSSSSSSSPHANADAITSASLIHSQQMSENARKQSSPFLPTPQDVVEEIISLAGVTSNDVVLDVGCGDGRVCVSAARHGARALGIEVDEGCITRARANITAADVNDLVEIYSANFRSSSDLPLIYDLLRRSTVLFLFLLPADVKTVISLLLQARGLSDVAAAAAQSSSSSSSSPPPSCPSSSSASSSSLTILTWTFSLPSSLWPWPPILIQPLKSPHSQLFIYRINQS